MSYTPHLFTLPIITSGTLLIMKNGTIFLLQVWCIDSVYEIIHFFLLMIRIYSDNLYNVSSSNKMTQTGRK